MEVNDFWKRKISFYFVEILDFDGDNRLGSKDVEGFKEMYKRMKNLTHDSPDLEKFSKFLNIWINKIYELTDKKSDQSEISVSLEEFMIYCEKLRLELTGKTTWPDSLGYMSDYIEALYKILDTDNDGIISRADYLSNSVNHDDRLSREHCWNYLCENDQSRDIDKKAFNQFCIEFLTSLDPKDRGNWIFGSFS